MSIRVSPPALRPLAFFLAGATTVLFGCAGPQFPGADEQAQYPIASLPLPPYSVREERLPMTGDWSGGSPQTGNASWANRQPGSSWPQADGGEQPPGDGSEAEWLPPPPTFNALADCERAYGAGQCRTGDEIYRQYAPPGTSVPPQIAYGYMPHAYGSMTGVLVNGYLAPPAAYVVGVPYQSYLFPPVISRYRVITPVVIQRYHTAPVYVRETIIQRGPIVHDYRVRPPYPGPSSVRPGPGSGAPPHWRPDGPPRIAQPPAPPPAPAPSLRPMSPIAPAPMPPSPAPASPRPGFRSDSQPAGPVAPPPRPPGSLPSTPQPPAALRPPLSPPSGASGAGPQPPSQRPPATASPPPALRPPLPPPAANPPAGPPAPSRQPPPRDRKRQEDPPGR